MLVYLHQEGRGIGLANKIRAYALQDHGRDTVEANLELGFRRTCATTASARRSCATSASGASACSPTTRRRSAGSRATASTVVARAPLEVTPHAGNIEYLRTKQAKLGHLLSGLQPRSLTAPCRATCKAGPEGDGLRIGIALARFNQAVTEQPARAARSKRSRGHGVADDAIDVATVPGAFELPLCAQRLAATGRYDAIVCLGAVVRGETPHFEFVAGEAARGIAEVARRHDLPVAFGVLTTDTMAQALARAGGERGQQGLRGGGDRARDGAGAPRGAAVLRAMGAAARGARAGAPGALPARRPGDGDAAEPRALLGALRAPTDEARAFARELVAGVRAERERIDALIAASAEHWRLPRLSRVDLNLLRLATYELLGVPEIPPSVTIDEAIEIARRFGSGGLGRRS